jgi:hypothetical protein
VIRKLTAGPFKTHQAATKWAERRGYDDYDLVQSGAKYLLHIMRPAGQASPPSQ